MSHAGFMIKEARINNGWTQQDLADRLPGIGRTSISKYENGAPIPSDVLVIISDALDDPALRIITIGTTSSRLVFDQVKIDFYITATKAIEEMEEAIDEIKQVMTFAYNINTIEKLSPDQRKEFNHMMDEIEDANHCLDMLDMAAHKMGADLKERNKRCILKYEAKGYISNKVRELVGEAG